jgi:hypothetical protein
LTQHIKPGQVKELREAARYARSIGLPLEAFATIHWSVTDAGDDPDGRKLARVREGLSKALNRRGIPFAAVWVRERLSSGHAEVEHCHMLFHLPRTWQSGKQLVDINRAIERLIGRHADYAYDHALELTFHNNGDIRYLLKGRTPEMQRELRIKAKWRKPQGLIYGKRCGTTQNLGRAARGRHAISGQSSHKP